MLTKEIDGGVGFDKTIVAVVAEQLAASVTVRI